MKPYNFKFIDLFAGIGGFHQAMRYLGGECVMAAEINQECVNTYKANFHIDEKEVRGDVNAIDPESIAPFDVLCAGFPCQPFSKAGAQKGFQDEKRGNLFYKIMDILDGHPEVKFVILENVRNLADKTENWDIITSELMKRNFYITEEPIILSPSDFGIPQIRERVYILGIRKDIRNEQILTNGYIHIDDLNLKKHYKKCKMGDAWSILEDNVDDTYIVSDEQELMIKAWDEFRISTGIKTIGFPIWLDSFGLGEKDSNLVFSNQGYDEMPKWKQSFLRRNRELYLNNQQFIDKWVKKYDMTNRIKLYKKFEWNCGEDVTDNTAQDELQTLMNDEAISLEAIVAYKQDIFSASDAEVKIKEIDLETENLKNQLKISAGTTQSKKEQQLAILIAILNEMNVVYEAIDPNGNLHFDDLFTKKDEVYSGSEATIFHLSRLYALSKVLNHNYPIVVDSFRAEDLSTSKENIVLDLYKELSNQVIFTTTLKLEELGKYDTRTDIHHIDYKDHAPSKMLSEVYVNEFCELLSSLSINL